MKVALVGQLPAPGEPITGGVERVIATLAPELAKLADVAIFVPGADRNQTSSLCGVDVNYRKRGIGPGALRYWTSDAMRIRGPVARFRPDIVHIQGMAGYAALISGPKVFTFHGLVDRDLLASSRGARWGRAARWLTARLLRFVEDCSQNVIGNVITISPYVKEALPGIARNQLFEIPNPIDRMYCEMPWQNAHASREPIILTVGRIGPRKNTLESIRIASHLLQEDQNAQHVICGSLDSAEYMAACDAAARAAGVRNRVHFLGNLPVPELIRWLDRASCLLMTSKQETAPLAISEATSRGVVAIAPYDFGIKYMICEGENGLFLPEGDTKAKSNILRLAMDRSWDRNAISARARGIYAPSAVAAATMAAYRTILASN